MTHIRDHRKIHLIGIGGCSMNGLAMILRARGYSVQGSDRAASPFTERLAELGIPVALSQRAENLADADLVIYSAAIKPDNPERAAARARGVPEIERSVALGQLSEGYGEVACIAGGHGKTTITSMLAHIAETGALDATIHVGGYVDILQGGTRIGAKDTFITEACEYVESFLTLRPTLALINNIDDDHLDYYADIGAIEDAFHRFLALLPPEGLFLGCADDPRVRAMLVSRAASAPKGRSISYGMEKADYTPSNIRYDKEGAPSFDLCFQGKALGRIVTHAPGAHIVIDAMAAAAVALALGTPMDKVAEGLAAFRNTRRRFEYYGEREGVRFYHDYAHHPAEIRTALDAASRIAAQDEAGEAMVFCVFQCNSYTRAKTLFTGKVDCFAQADTVLVPDIFPGREQDDGSVHARDMVEAIRAGGATALYLPTFEEIRLWLDQNMHPGDLVVTLGSGDVYLQTKKLL